MARLGERVFDESRIRLGGIRYPKGRLGMNGQAQRPEQLANLAQLPRIATGDDQLAQTRHSAFFCAAMSSDTPSRARSSIAIISSRLKGSPSAVPCSSTIFPRPVMTTF